MERASDSLPNHLREHRRDEDRGSLLRRRRADKEIFSPMDRSKAGQRNGAIVISHAPASTANHR